MADDKTIKTALILTAYDRMSRVVNESVNKSIRSLNELQQKSEKISRISMRWGKDAAMIGMAAGASLYKPVQAYSEMEDSATRLETTMMKTGGVVSKNFSKINSLARELGNKLPGTTSDFQKMMTTMLRAGVTEESIINGVGKAAAYLSIAIEMPYDEAGKAAAKLKEATGVADNQMEQFLDTIARVNQLGVGVDEMNYAFSRSAGALKLMNIQGLAASKSISSIYAMLIKQGMSGETVGTGMTSMLTSFMNTDKMSKFSAEAARFGVSLKFVDQKSGEFMGIENMMKQFDKLRGLNPQQRASLVQALLGPGQDASIMNTLIAKGMTGYKEMITRMNEQANLQQKVDKQLGTLTNIWDATTGTFKNAIAGFAGAMAPELKGLTSWLGRMSESLSKFIEQHPKLAKILGLSIGGFAAMMLSVGGALLAIGGISKAVSIASYALMNLGKFVKAVQFGLFALKFHLTTTTLWMKIAAAAQWLFNTSLYGCPLVWIIAGILAVIAVIILMVKYWDKIREKITFLNPVIAAFKRAWDSLKQSIVAFWNTLKPVLITVGTMFREAFSKLMVVLRPVITIIGRLWEKFKPFLTPVFKAIAISVFIPIAAALSAIGVVIFILIKAITYLVNAFTWMINIGKKVVKWFKSLGSTFYDAGRNIILSIWNGIKSMAMKPVEAIMNMVKKIRNLLPFSPAKEGPFRDLHRIRIVETIAQTIKPASAVKAMRGVVDIMANTGLKLHGGGYGGGMNLTYSPVVNINGGSASREDIMSALNSHKSEFIYWLDEAQKRNQRLTF